MERRMRRAYELGRLQRASWLSVPLLLVVAFAAVLGARERWTLIVGAALYVVGVVALFRGQHVARGVVPGVVAGLVPLLLATGARAYGHVCVGGRCTTLCVPACFVGGLAAASIVAVLVRRPSGARRSWVTAGVVASLVGSLGCACVGGFGIMALLGGLVLGAAPAALLVRARAGA